MLHHTSTWQSRKIIASNVYSTTTRLLEEFNVQRHHLPLNSFSAHDSIIRVFKRVISSSFKKDHKWSLAVLHSLGLASHRELRARSREK